MLGQLFLLMDLQTIPIESTITTTMNKSRLPHLLSPLDLRGLVLRNRVVMAPLTRARDSAEERQAQLNDWAARLCSIESEKPIEVGEY